MNSGDMTDELTREKSHRRNENGKETTCKFRVLDLHDEFRIQISGLVSLCAGCLLDLDRFLHGVTEAPMEIVAAAVVGVSACVSF